MGTRERRTRSNEGDLLLTSLFKESGANVEEVAIAADGGFVRCELSPGSDLDIVILHNGAQPEAALGELVNKILYPIWDKKIKIDYSCLLYTSPSPRDRTRSRMPSSA